METDWAAAGRLLVVAGSLILLAWGLHHWWRNR